MEARGPVQMGWPRLSVVPGLVKTHGLHESQFPSLQMADDAGGFSGTCHSKRPRGFGPSLIFVGSQGRVKMAA